MNWKDGSAYPGVPAALGAALLFGTGTPLAKLLLDTVSPWMLAGLLYLGSGVGLTLYRRLIQAPAVRLPPKELAWFGGAIVAGGIIGPVLLLVGLTGMPASGASLLLNAEGVHSSKPQHFFLERYEEAYVREMQAFVDCVLNDRVPSVSGRDGLIPVIMGLAATRSLKEGRPVRLTEIAPV